MNSNRMPKIMLIVDQMDEDDLKDLSRDYSTRAEQIHQGIICDD
jgi:hypothetical protein